MADKVERINRELKYKGKILNVYSDKVKLSNGNMDEWDFIGHKGAAAVVPVLPNGKIIMVRQYRNALDRFTLEIPAGGRDGADEPMITCASRELEEETGYRCDNLEFLISVHTTVAFCNERIDVFVAKDLIKTQQRLDEDESIDLVECEPEDLCREIFDGKIQDGKTISAILAYCKKYL